MSNLISEETSPKTAINNKLSNAKARQSDNTTGTAGLRQSPPPKAWSSGHNPLLQRTPARQQNGATVQPQSAATGGSLGLLIEGARIRIILNTGAEFEGLYSTSSNSAYTLKMVQQKKLPGSADMPNGTRTTNREQSSMSFQKKDVTGMHAQGMSLPLREVRQQNGNSFRTDTAISGNRHQGERTLKRWVPDESIETDSSLESARNKSSSAGWDQFAANERLFGLKTDYDETIYTTPIDKSHPEYDRRYAEADKKAREIENSLTNNRHVAEERITDNVTADGSGLDEEDKYSGVHRNNDFPPLAASGRPDKYTPPARRPPTGKPTVAGAPFDPAIISSQLARPKETNAEPAKTENIEKVEKVEKVQNAEKNDKSETAVKSEIPTPSTTAGLSSVSPSDVRTTPVNTSATASRTASRTASPQTKPSKTPNATATVEQDVVSAFKGFAAQQRSQADRLRINKARVDKESKLAELKKFAATFKLHSPLPNDLVAIIAKDPSKQREIQENARRNAEQSEQEKLAKAAASQAATPAVSTSDQKTVPRPAATAAPVPTNNTPNRQTAGRPPNAPPQGPYHNPNSRPDRSIRSQPNTFQQGLMPGNPRMRNLDQGKNGQMPQIMGYEHRQPPTGPSNNVDPVYNRRTSAIMANKLNPNSHEFRPNPFASTFSPNGNQSNGSSPHSSSSPAVPQAIPTASGSLLRRKPGQPSKKANAKLARDIIQCALTEVPPPGRTFDDNGGIKPAFNTNPTWRQIADDEPENSTMLLTCVEFLKNIRLPMQAMSSPQPAHVHPQVPHQHQLPFHMQQGAHNASQRQSPRQPPLHMQNNQHNQGPNAAFHTNDDHRMVPSHSAQSYASPRLGQVNMSYPSPMGQPAQLSFTPQPGMQYPMGPGAPQMAQYRSYSGGHQFMPQQATHMGAPVMMQGPGGNTFIQAPNMVTPGPPMLFPVAQPHFGPPGNVPPPNMANSNGYPSPGRAAPMMMPQGSQGAQPIYAMSPGMQFGQPIYAQQPPSQMQNMRGYPPQGQQQFGTSPQMHQYGQPHRGAPNGNYKQNYQQQHAPHPSAPQNQIPTGPQAHPQPNGDDAK